MAYISRNPLKPPFFHDLTSIGQFDRMQVDLLSRKLNLFETVVAATKIGTWAINSNESRIPIHTGTGVYRETYFRALARIAGRDGGVELANVSAGAPTHGRRHCAA